MASLVQHAKQEDLPVATKQWNRSHATKRLDDEMTRAARDPGYQFSILLVEFEGLSETADRLGYAAEEDVWRRTLGFLIQDLDAHDLCCRLSGDEFLLILSGKGYVEANTIVERLRRRWKPAPASRQANIQISIGIASYPTHGCALEQLLCAADETLHADRMRHERVHGEEESRPGNLRTHH